VQVPFEGFGRLRNAVLDQLTGDWVFSLDADERCTGGRGRRNPPRGGRSARARRLSGAAAQLRVRSLDPPLRLLSRLPAAAAVPARPGLRYTEDAVHETYTLEGSLGVLREPIAQVPFRDLSQMLSKMQRYSTLGVQRLAQQRVPPSMWRALLHGTASFPAPLCAQAWHAGRLGRIRHRVREL